MIREIRLRFGRSPGTPPETVQLTPVTVFVGPNNSGKSAALKDVEAFCSSIGDPPFHAFPIINHLEYIEMTPAQAQERINEFVLAQHIQSNVGPDEVIVGEAQNRFKKADYIDLLANINTRKEKFVQHYLKSRVMRIGGGSQINLTAERVAGDLQKEAVGSLQILFQDNAKRQALRRIIYEAFGKYFVIDPTLLGKLRVRLSDIEPENEVVERGVHEQAVQFHSKAMPIERVSDGTRAFIGVLSEILAGYMKVLLIDEPEAFLHPPLAYKLGREIGRAQIGSERRVFISTHSSHFVMGCIQSGAPVNIIRLTYRDGVPTARILPNGEILRLMRNPLLRSSNILNGLFYESVVITESDTDRAFYEEINQRLLRYRPEWGIPSCLFVNAQNKQTIHTLMRPLRDLGIPAACITDIDVVKEGGGVWSKLLTSASVPGISQRPLSDVRAVIKTKLEQTGKDMKRDGGFGLLQAPDKAAANDLFDELGRYGIFALRHGEIESWLKHLGASGHGTGWLIDIFERMGEDDQADSYVLPEEGNVWEFIKQVKSWLADPSRKGIPA